MTTTSSAETIRTYVSKHYIEPARRKGEKRVRVTAGDVHRNLTLKNRVPNVCQVLDSRKFCKENRLVIEDKTGPPSGMGTRMVYVYRLEDESQEATKEVSFDDLHGLLKRALQSLGGGEAFIRRERSSFYGDRRENPK